MAWPIFVRRLPRVKAAPTMAPCIHGVVAVCSSRCSGVAQPPTVSSWTDLLVRASLTHQGEHSYPRPSRRPREIEMTNRRSGDHPDVVLINVQPVRAGSSPCSHAANRRPDFGGRYLADDMADAADGTPRSQYRSPRASESGDPAAAMCVFAATPIHVKRAPGRVRAVSRPGREPDPWQPPFPRRRRMPPLPTPRRCGLRAIRSPPDPTLIDQKPEPSGTEVQRWSES
jgi:hypothetical protein